MQMERNATAQDISWFLDLASTDKLDLAPPYQRKSVWNNKDREFYIDTILNNYPCPAVFLYKDLDENGVTTYRVIDGKQRLTTIIDFAKDKFSFAKSSNNSDLAGKKFSELNAAYKKVFWNYSIPIEQINTDNEEAIKSIFDRLNRNNKKLTPQELRNARYDGQLFQFVFNEALDDFWKSFISIGPKDRARMEDEQFISELVLLTLTGTTQGFNQDILDKLYSDYDEFFDEQEMIREKFVSIKEYICKLENVNKIVSNYFKTRTNFYTLWNFILLKENNLPSEQTFAQILLDISDKVKLPTEELAKFPPILKYFEQTKGAATDKKARILRLEALQELTTDIQS